MNANKSQKQCIERKQRWKNKFVDFFRGTLLLMSGAMSVDEACVGDII